MSTANPNKLKIKDIITVVLLALINVVIFLRQLRPVRNAHYHHSDAGIFRPAEGIVYFIIGTKVKKARCDPDLQHCPRHYGRIPAVHHPLYSLRCHCRAAAVEDGLRQCEGADRQLCHQSGAGRIRQHHHSLYAIAAKAMADQMVTDGRQDTILAASQMLQSWVSVALVAGVIVAAFIGAMIGKRIVKKHLAA